MGIDFVNKMLNLCGCVILLYVFKKIIILWVFLKLNRKNKYQNYYIYVYVQNNVFFKRIEN